MLYRKKSCLVTYFSFFYLLYYIPVYVSFTIVKNCSFVMGFVILAISFRLKTIFNVKTYGIFKKKLAW